MTLRTPRIVVLLLLALSVVARGQSAKGSVTPPAGFPAIGEPPRVTLIAAGAEPRKALRLVVSSSHRSHMDIEMTVEVATNVGGLALPPAEPPAVRIGADLTVTNVSPAGDVTYTIAFTGAGLADAGAGAADPAFSATLASVSAGLKSIRGTATVTNRGINRDVRIDTSKVTTSTVSEAMDSVTTMMNGMSSPLPEEPVGVGARWEVRQALRSGAVTAFQKVEFELVAFDGRTASLKVKTDQSGPPQPIKIPMMPPGASANLESMTGTGSGTMSVPLDGLVPTSQADSMTKMVMSIADGGPPEKPQKMAVVTTIKLKIAPGK